MDCSIDSGREKEYQKENQLMQMNQRLLERNMELLEESVEAGRRIRHDARHHNALIAEYARSEQIEVTLDVELGWNLTISGLPRPESTGASEYSALLK